MGWKTTITLDMLMRFFDSCAERREGGEGEWEEGEGGQQGGEGKEGREEG